MIRDTNLKMNGIHSVSRRTLYFDDPLDDYVLAHSLCEHSAQSELPEATRVRPHAGMYHTGEGPGVCSLGRRSWLAVRRVSSRPHNQRRTLDLYCANCSPNILASTRSSGAIWKRPM